MLTFRKKKNTLLNKIILGILSLLIVGLIFFVAISIINLSPVDPKSEETVLFVVEKGASKNTIADKLEKEGLIRNALFFKVYIKLNSDKELYAGTYNLSKGLSVDEIITILNSNNSVENEGIYVTFIEGKRLSDYVKKIAETFNYKEEDIYALLENEEYLNGLIDKYWFITDEIKNEKIYYPLEGYLFADTYNLKKDSTIEEVIDTMLYTLGQKLNSYKEEIELSEYSVHELLTLSSIVELEGANSLDRKGVAGVFYNRLALNEPLGSDVTTYYGVKKTFDKDLSNNNLRNCNGYNTRSESTCPIIGLPVGPIASPSFASISAVIEPETHDYYFFVADKNKKTYFNKTYKEHTDTVKDLKKSGLWYEY